MRGFALSSLVIPALLLGGCGTETVVEPSGAPGGPSLDRGKGKADPTWEFTTIDVPGARATTAFGINPDGHIVGSYTNASGTHGFLRQDGLFTTIDYPGARLTIARGINPDGEIVGEYLMPGEPAVNAHGFLRRTDGTFVPVDYPGAVNTIAQRILPDGTILGCRHDNDRMASMLGILMGRSGNDSTTAFGSMHNGATPDGRFIVGLYTNEDMADRGEGYVIEDGEFKPFLVPGSSFTAAWDVNPRREIVGVYQNPTVHGFLRRGDEYSAIDFPGATATRAFGINPQGHVVGNYTLGGLTHGFLATSR